MTSLAGKTSIRTWKVPLFREPILLQQAGFISPLVAVVLLLSALFLAGYGVWQISEREETIRTLDLQLEQAERTISKFQLIVARLEKQILNTDATMAQSGNELARELKRLDEEMRRQATYLTNLDDTLNAGLALQRENRSTDLARTSDLLNQYDARLQDQENSTAQVREQLEAVQAGLEIQATRDESLRIALETRAAADATAATERESILSGLQSLERRLDTALAAQEGLLTTLQQTQNRQQKELVALSRTLAERPLSDPALLQRQQEIGEQVNRVDAARQQLVQRFLALDSRLQNLENELSGLQINR